MSSPGMYRGKPVAGGEMVKGWYRFNPYYQIHTIAYFEELKELADKVPNGVWREYEVIPETVGQATDLKDKNGVEIFADDILTYYIPEYGKPVLKRGVVRMIEYCWMCGGVYLWALAKNGDIEVIGNIHNNPKPKESK